MQQSETITSSGWIDFNEDSIGLTTWTEGEEVFTEIRYSSITDWYMKGNVANNFKIITNWLRLLRVNGLHSKWKCCN